jgi:hypothetical protein
MGQPINRARGAPDRVIQKIPLQKSCAPCARYERGLIDLSIDQDTIDQDTIDQDTIDQDTIDQDTIDQDTIDLDQRQRAKSSNFLGVKNAANRENAMRKMSLIAATLIGAAMLCAAPVSLQRSPETGLTLSLERADARVGRPLTPGSVAGVHRRVERRAVRRCAAGVTCY